MVRKYARRSRCGDGGAAGAGVSYSDPVLLDSGGEEEEEEDYCSDEDFVDLTSSSPQSRPHEIPLDLRSPALSWPLDPLPSNDFSSFEERKARKKRRNPWRMGGEREAAATGTATLMEAQEFGEMMEHVDEVNFALDGLRRGQPARTRRTSLLSMLSICETQAQRRLLQVQGITSSIINAILDLGFDDPPSTVAAAALFYVLATDVQGDDLLDSPSCITYLIKLLNPPVVDSVHKATSVSSKILAITKPHMEDTRNKVIDSSAKVISSRVNEILSSCKAIKSEDTEALERPELSSKLIALLTMEKACLSTVSFEDTSDIVKSVGKVFKERLRELGGLDAIFDVLPSCHSILKGCCKCSSVSFSFRKDEPVLQSMTLLLKCLKIMENATFLSQNNQDHLLKMKCKINAGDFTLSFVGVIISVINLFSDFSFLQSIPSDGKSVLSEINDSQMMPTFKDNNDEPSASNYAECSGFDKPYGIKSFAIGHKRQKCSSSKSEVSTSCLSMTMDYHFSASCHGLLYNSFNEKLNDGNRVEAEKDTGESSVHSMKSSRRWISIKANGSMRKMDSPHKKSHMSKNVKGDGQMDTCDPFAFDECEFEPSKWELLENRKEKSFRHEVALTDREFPNGCQFPNVFPDDALSQLTSEKNCSPQEKNWLPVTLEDSNLLEDCLLTSVKVLMNLTNDNPVGCQKIAACGGLDAMVSLIARRFQSLNFCAPLDSELKGKAVSHHCNNDDWKHKRLRDDDIDLLVAILGLLVNLIEKDSHNRLRLVTACVPVNQPGNAKGNDAQKDVIPLLCSIFLANQENVEAVDGRVLQCDDENSLLQGEREAEMMIIEAYSALLLAFLSTESMQIRQTIAKFLPNQNLQVLVPVLEKFVAFHLTLNMIPLETHAAVVNVIESCKGP